MAGYVIMGVAGCGKTSVGEALAQLTGLSFVDGDTLHSQANIDKMASGKPLTDADRAPWLRDVGAALKGDDIKLIGCSALKRAYRDLIRAEADAPVKFIHLHTQKSIIARRMQARDRHFMPLSLLDSQFEALELLQPDEDGHLIEIAKPLDAVVNEASAYINDVLK